MTERVSSERPHCTIFADGGARGNPGPAAAGVVILADDGSLVAEISQPLGIATNNIAEYRALILALERALAEGFHSADVRLDSELIVRQLNGQYRVRNANIEPLYRAVRKLRARFDSVRVGHVRRENNAHADRLVNAALDSQSKEEATP